jgi:hypothetical protein
MSCRSAATDSASETFTWTVTGPVTLGAIADQTNQEGNTVSLSVSGSDSGSGTLTYTAVGLPGGLKINPSTGAITGTVGLGAAANGPYFVTVTAADGTSSASQTFTWAVTSPITLTTVADQTNDEGDTVSLSVGATDASGGTVQFAAVGLPSGLKMSSSGAITGTIAPGTAALGPYTVVVTASDGTSSSNLTFTWNVNNPISITDPGDQMGVVGQENVELQVEASNSGGGTLTYSATGLPKDLSINASTGLISGTIGDDPNAVGNFTVTVSVTNRTSTAQTAFNWQVDGFLFVADKGGPDGKPVLKVGETASDRAESITPNQVTVAPDGTYMAALDTKTGAIKVWQTKPARHLALFRLTSNTPVTAIAFSPTDPNLLAIGTKGGVVLFDVKAKKQVAWAPFLDGNASVSALAFSSDGDLLVAGSGTPGTDVGMAWRLKADNKGAYSFDTSWTLPGATDEKSTITSLLVPGKVAPNGVPPTILGTDGVGGFTQWKFAGGKYTPTRLGQTGTTKGRPAQVLAVSPNGRWVVTGTSEGYVFVYRRNPVTGEIMTPSTDYRKDWDNILAIVFDTSDHVSFLTPDGVIWRLPFNDDKGTLGKPGDPGSAKFTNDTLKNNGSISMALSPDGRYLVIGGKRNDVIFVDLKNATGAFGGGESFL